MVLFWHHATWKRWRTWRKQHTGRPGIASRNAQKTPKHLCAIDKQYYNIGAVVGILTFIILAIGSLLTYRNSKSYKEEGGF